MKISETFSEHVSKAGEFRKILKNKEGGKERC